VLLTAATLAAFTTQAQTDSTATNKPPVAAKPKAKRYVGKIAGVDSDAKTITISLDSGKSQTLHVTSKTRIRKDGQPATLADVTVGQRVAGGYHEDESGNLVANTIAIGQPKPKAAPPAASAPAPQ
jgi:Cu/Ag efflux protein CusF